MLQIISYISLLVFALAVGVRVWRIRRMPPHLRWELYPVAHDRHARHGGSYYEESDWWEKPRVPDRRATLRAMLPEMLFIRALFLHNRPLWYRSFPFHFGLYLLAGFLGLTALGGLFALAGADGAVARALFALTSRVGWAGLILASAGAAALLHRRLRDEDLADYTTPWHLLNLGFILVTLLVCVFAFGVYDRGFAALRLYAAALLRLDTGAPAGGWAVGTAILLGSLLVAYIPLTHMSHFFTKWFMWHDVRWDDAPLPGNEELTARVNACLQQPVSWSGPHLQADGKKTWADLAAEEAPK